MKKVRLPLLLLIVLFGGAAGLAKAAPSEVPYEPVKPSAANWAVAKPEEVRRQLDAWLREHPVDATLQTALEALWTPLPASAERLNAALLDSLCLASPEIAAYRERCRDFDWQPISFGRETVIPAVPVGLESRGYLFGTLRLTLAESLIRARLFDEAAVVLAELTPENTIDPAAMLLARAVTLHQTRNLDEAAGAIREFNRLAEDDPAVPRRYREIAKLLDEDIRQSQKEDDLQSIARGMNDVQRRLEKGRTGEKTQGIEKDILEALDKSIENLEKQLKECDGQGDQGQQGNKPAKDSRVLRGKGPGEITDKEIGETAGWGDLPPKEREEALLRMEREFPSHYRAIIESYFREMAASPEQ